ncbi:MAG: 30S ribosomal protein S1 [Clostridiaceae bacterium]|nr:30S ribosomal protein S1 [Clostridiaceae bacterium]
MTDMSMGDMLDSLEGTLKRINSGDVVKGTVISLTEEEVFVNIGFMSDGIISSEELSQDTAIKPKDILKVGDEIEVYILNVNDGEGNVALSLKKAEYYKVWDEFEDSFNKGTLIKVTVAEVVKGGVIAFVKGVRGFIPASQVSASYVENLQEYVGKVLEVKVIELDKENEKVILSRKEVEKVELEEKKSKIWDTLVKGEKRTGVVKRLVKFGAFVDIGGMDGLIHISEMSWKRISDPSEVVSVGDKVEVYIIDFDKSKDRISLGLKEVTENPWNVIFQKIKVGSIVEGTVVNLLDFGAFVEIEAGVEGLVHISNISEERISKPSSVLNIGDKVKVKIIEIDEKSKKIGLSIKDAEFKEEENYASYNNNNSNLGTTIGDLFKDKFKDFK